MSLAVIGPGFGRTGTMSLKHALEQLGFGPCHHMEEVFAHPEQIPHWQAVAAGRPVAWDDVFAGYRSQVDWPGAHPWRELAATYPQSKVILSVRPEAAWWTSFSATIGALFDAPDQVPLPPHLRTMRDVAIELIQVQTFGCPSTDRQGVLAAYRRRTEEVCAAIPAERLLVFNVAEGWAPLCRFLDVPMPDVPFPRMNSTEQFWKTVAANNTEPAR
jgi:Sulfotransferase domain